MSGKRSRIGRHRATLRNGIDEALAAAAPFERVVVGALLLQPELAATVEVNAIEVLHAAPELAIAAIATLKERGVVAELAAVDRLLEEWGYEQPDTTWLVGCLDYAGTPTWTAPALQGLVGMVRLRGSHIRELAERDDIASRLAAGADLDAIIARLVALRDTGAAR